MVRLNLAKIFVAIDVSHKLYETLISAEYAIGPRIWPEPLRFASDVTQGGSQAVTLLDRKHVPRPTAQRANDCVCFVVGGFAIVVARQASLCAPPNGFDVN